MILPEANRIEAQEVRKQGKQCGKREQSNSNFNKSKYLQRTTYPVRYFIAKQLFRKGIKIPLILSNRNSDRQIRV
jgi:hypothetical protein